MRALSVLVVACFVLMLGTSNAQSPLPPSQQCGWPAVYAGGHFGPPTVRLAQYLLGGALHLANVNATGTLTNSTTLEIKQFQTSVGLQADGFLGPETWTALVAATILFATPRPSNDSVAAILGLQDSLTVNGFPTTMTGVFDSATITSLALFQQDRKDATCTNGTFVTTTTWHLLATGCNATGIFWFDAGWPQGSLSLETLTCLREQGGFRFATYECWVEQGPQGSFWPECVQNIANTWAAGYEAVGVYMFAQRYYDPIPQALWLLGNLTMHNVSYQAIMLDIEGDKWGEYTQEQNREFITSLRAVLEAEGVNVTVYCGDEWPHFFGKNFTTFSDLPLMYAHYDNIPSFYDFFPTYGGWDRPAGKQFWDGSQGESICNSGELDWDWSAKRFW
ncbi:Hypothetical protein, putative [Bodo saltans]|uniref:Peptidoglycan binding-like domain-containing protein n=1 Tax=Bodo saltans TaxID=75058 RepID=A0A0S4JVY0_BODSA|nr:Hypothetical protein, putative [Bodo saltans]|eukprot:CUG93286.1 Hypothetical protein, putative [Bodo saltans]